MGCAVGNQTPIFGCCKVQFMNVSLKQVWSVLGKCQTLEHHIYYLDSLLI